MLLALILISAPLAALAQDDTKGSNPGAEHKLSIGTGIGFATPIAHIGNNGQTGFEWQLDVMYRITDSIAVGAWMQVIPVNNFVGFSLAGEARYHFNFLQSRKGFLGKLTPYAGGGIGLYHVGGRTGASSYDGFLFTFPVGIEFDLTEHIALTNEMRFNFMAGANKAGLSDTFYYSWQMLGARYRF
ncbi:MAG: outer membrane beta-barrel protein [Myxococcota bacterium]|nr:outer membrane beta-barrel protein [Myxococcota bacterium]